MIQPMEPSTPPAELLRQHEVAMKALTDADASIRVRPCSNRDELLRDVQREHAFRKRTGMYRKAVRAVLERRQREGRAERALDEAHIEELAALKPSSTDHSPHSPGM
jgi:Arc/MetJ-type ribon-helix-helix transcriptional regulator